MCPWTHLESSFLSISTFFLIPCFKLHPTSLVTWDLCILWRYFIQRLKDSLTRCHLFEKQSFCCVSIYCLSRWSPKAGSLSSDWCSMLPGEQGPCVVRPLLCVHNDPLPVSCVGQRLKPGQCLSLETCGTAFTNLGWIQTKMFPAHEFSGVQRLLFTYLRLEAPETKILTEAVTFFPRTTLYKNDTETVFSENNTEIIFLGSNILGPWCNKWSQKSKTRTI